MLICAPAIYWRRRREASARRARNSPRSGCMNLIFHGKNSGRTSGFPGLDAWYAGRFGARLAVAEAAQVATAMPNASSFSVDSQSSKYVSGVAYTQTSSSVGVITATSRSLGTGVDGDLTMIGTLQANGQVTWVCGGAGTTIPAKYRPASCQGT